MTVQSTLEFAQQALSVSIVLYRPDPVLLDRTLTSLRDAVVAARAGRHLPVHVYLVDNGGGDDAARTAGGVFGAGIECSLIAGHGNIGYGRGHNLAIERASSRYHLVLNPDVKLADDTLLNALSFLDGHREAGLLTPQIVGVHGEIQYLCRRRPALLDLFARGFLPSNLRKLFSQRLSHYEMRDRINGRDVVWDPPIVTGCFMLFRTDVLKQLGGFDARYFLYFEDYDLSLRTHDVARVVYVPAVSVQHYGGGASRKGYSHIRMFAVSAWKFYRRFGWKWL